MPDDARFAGASADGFGHFEHTEPAGRTRHAVEFAFPHRHRRRMPRKIQSLRRVFRLADRQIVLGLLRPARFGNAYHQRRFQIADRQRIRQSGRIGVVEKIDLQVPAALLAGKLIPVGSVQRHLQQLGPQCGPADPVDDGRLEAFARRPGDLARPDTRRKLLHFRVYGRAGINRPVGEMRHFPVFVRVFDLAEFDLLHFRMDRREAGRHPVHICRIEIHSRKIDLETAFPVHKTVLMASVQPDSFIHIRNLLASMLFRFFL